MSTTVHMFSYIITLLAHLFSPIHKISSAQLSSTNMENNDGHGEKTTDVTLETKDDFCDIETSTGDIQLRQMAHDENSQPGCEDNEKKKQKRKEIDGGYGWIVVIARFYMQLIAVGTPLAFGVLLVELVDYFESSRADVAWIGSLALGLSLAMGPVSARFVHHFGCRPVAIVGCFIAITSTTASFFASSILYLYISYGLAAGIGLGLSTLPAVVMVLRYFDKRRGLAIAISSSGAAIGNVVIPPLFNVLVDTYGWRGLMFILAGLMLNGVVCGALFIQPKYMHAGNKDDDKASEKIASKSTSAWIKCPSVVRNGEFVVYLTAIFFSFLGFPVLFVHLPDMAILRGIEKDRAVILVSIMGITSFIARAVFGFISDLRWVNRKLMFGLSLLTCGGATMVCSLMQTFPTFVVYAVIAGTFTGVQAFMFMVVATDIAKKDDLNNAVGLTLLTVGLALTAASPIAGWLYDHSGTYNP